MELGGSQCLFRRFFLLKALLDLGSTTNPSPREDSAGHTTIPLGASSSKFQIVFRQALQNSIQQNVRRLLLHIGTVLILAFCTWGHVSELFDHWDNTFKTGNDMEYSTVIVVLITGAVLCFAHLAIVVARSRTRTAHILPPLVWAGAIPTSVSSIAHSPPVPLRI